MMIDKEPTTEKTTFLSFFGDKLFLIVFILFITIIVGSILAPWIDPSFESRDPAELMVTGLGLVIIGLLGSYLEFKGVVHIRGCSCMPFVGLPILLYGFIILLSSFIFK